MREEHNNEKLLKSLLETRKVAEKHNKIEEATEEILKLIEKTLNIDLIFCIIYDKNEEKIYSNRDLKKENLDIVQKHKPILKQEKIAYIENKIENLELNDLILIPLFDKKVFLGVFGLGRKNAKQKWSEGEKLYFANIANILSQLINKEKEKQKIIDECEGISKKVIHDVRSILQMISLSAEQGIIRKERKNEYFERIIATSLRGEEITKDYLSINKQKIKTILNCDIKEILERITNSLKKTAGDDLALEIFLEEDLPKIKGNSFSIEQIIRNILNNAYQAIKGKGYIRISAKKENENVVVTVIDSGPGIPQELREKIFEPHFSTKEGSTGLGLSFVKKEIESLGGSIELIQKPNCGAKFVLTFPIAEKNFKLRIATIFLVEDEDLIRNFIEELLKQNGYKVIAAENFRDALAMISSFEELDYLITDINLPDGKGTKIARLLKEKFPRLKIIFITGQREGVLPSFEDAHVLTKPFHSKELLALLS
ncbi:ATP-binding protein [Thermodesulfatator atlanticus]|uniref:ATP-binding protein n=1 Tax=Thermodesulfatator atlanticus TaxID=501497 RepID=UPI0003B40770|nr:ATP-binding protein [Thermodesulfatator atlanticus]